MGGAGPRANDSMAIIVKLSDMYDFCAVCDKDEERARLAAKRHAVEPVYTDVEEMLKNE